MRRVAIPSALALAFVAAVVGPAVAADRDNDGLRDGWEKRYGVTSPKKRDSDGDGVIDSAEDNDGDRLGNLGEQRWGTHPGKKDTDKDGKPDGMEDRDRDGISNAREQDRRKLPKRLKPTLTQTKLDVPNNRGKCLTKAGISKPKKCWFGPQDAAQRVAIMGDSHALMWLPGAVKAANQAGVRLVTLFKGGCPPLRGIMNTGQFDTDRGKTCRAWRNEVYGWLEKNPVDLLIIAHADSYGIVDKQGKIITGKPKIKAWTAGARKTLNQVFDPGRTMLLGDVPRNQGNPIKCLKRNPGNISACVSPRETQQERTVEAALRKAAREQGSQFRTLFNKICTYGPCPLVQGNILMWRDRHHVTATFAEKLAPSIRELMTVGLATAAGSTTAEIAVAPEAELAAAPEAELAAAPEAELVSAPSLEVATAVLTAENVES